MSERNSSVSMLFRIILHILTSHCQLWGAVLERSWRLFACWFWFGNLWRWHFDPHRVSWFITILDFLELPFSLLWAHKVSSGHQQLLRIDGFVAVLQVIPNDYNSSWKRHLIAIYQSGSRMVGWNILKFELLAAQHNSSCLQQARVNSREKKFDEDSLSVSI